MTEKAGLLGNTSWCQVSLCNGKMLMPILSRCDQRLLVHYHVWGANSLSVWRSVTSVSLGTSVVRVQNNSKQIILLLPNNEALFKHKMAHESMWVWILFRGAGQISSRSPPLPSLPRNEEWPPGWQRMDTGIPKPESFSSSEHLKANQSTHKLFS